MAPFLVEQTSESFSHYSSSRSVSKIPISCTDPSGSFHILKPGIPWSHFSSGESMSLAILASSSFAIEADPEDNGSVQFRIPKKSAGTSHDRIAFYISASGEVGVGTKDPESSFDIRDTKQDIDPKLARLNKEKLLLLDRTDAKAELKAQTLKTARAIGGVSFNGSANINLPGVNLKGNQDTTGNAATATKLVTGRYFRTNLGSTTKFIFDGSADNTHGVTGTLPVSNGGTGLTSISTLLNSNVTSVSGNAGTATILATARTIGGVSFNGSANINLPGVNTTGNQNTTGKATTAGTADKAIILNTTRAIGGVNFDGSAAIVPRQYKGSTTNLNFLGTDFTTQGVPAKAGTVVYLKPNVLVSPTAAIATAAGSYFYNVTLPIGLSPAGIVVYGDDVKGCVYKVYASFIPTATYSQIKNKYVQIDGSGLSGIAIGTALSKDALTKAMKAANITWDSSVHALTIGVTTDGTDTIYGGSIAMA